MKFATSIAVRIFCRLHSATSYLAHNSNAVLTLILILIVSQYSLAQCTNHVHHDLEAKPFNGHYYTPPAQWIQDKMNTPTQNLVGDPPCAVISVTYNNFPAEAQAAFETAVEIWEAVISTNVTISINAIWAPSDGLLGSAITYPVHGFENAPTGYRYPVSLANQIAGYDIYPASPDAEIYMNSDISWYFESDGLTPNNQIDYISVVMHEIGHSLGISCSKNYVEETGVGTFGSPFYMYDSWLTNGIWGAPLIEIPNGVTLGNEFTSNDVFWDGPHAVNANGDNPVAIFAPTTYTSASSLSHLDEDTFPPGNTNSLMSPHIGQGEAIHNPGDIVIGMLKDLGWDICYADNYCEEWGGYIGDTCDDGDPSTLNETITDGCSCSGDGGFIPFTCGDFGGNIYCYSNNENTTWKYFSENGEPLNLNFSQGSIEGGYDNLTIYDGNSTEAPVLYTTDFQTDDGIVDISDISVTSSSAFLTMHLETDFVESCQFGNNDFEEMIWDVSCITGCENISLNGQVFMDGSDDVVIISNCIYEYQHSRIYIVQPDNQYIFTSDNNGYITVRTGGMSGPILNAGYSPLTATTAGNGNLYVSWTADADCNSSGECITATVQCYTCEMDCPALLGNYGDPCDDGNILTTSDSISEDCECEGINEGCVNANPYAFVNLDGTSETQIIEYCNYENEYSEIFNVEADATYRFTSSGEIGYITLRSGTFNGPVVGAGFSPLTITTSNNDDLFAHWNYDEFCSTAQYCITTSVQCVSCGITCPDLMGNVGDSCDDEDPNTINDQITENCECEGISIFPTPDNDNPCHAINLSCGDEFIQSTYYATESGLAPLSCTSGSEQDVFYRYYVEAGYEYHIQIDGESDFNAVLAMYDYDGECDALTEIECVNSTGVDGVEEITFVAENYQYYYFRVYDLDDDYGEFDISWTCTVSYDCEELQGNIGSVCNDGDPQTIYDTINEDCECVGIPIPENDICENAQELMVYYVDECEGNEVYGTTTGAGGPFIAPSCAGSEGFNADVYYWFNSGIYARIFIDFIGLTSEPYANIVEVMDQCDGSIIFCANGSGNYTIDVNEGTNYIIRVTNSNSYTGPFSLCLTGNYACYEFVYAFPGDPCDDDNPLTSYDVITTNCDCEGTYMFNHLEGLVDWEFDCGSREFTIDFYQPGTDELVYSATSSMGYQGYFFLADIPLGTYDVYVKVDGCLSDEYPGRSFGYGTSTLECDAPRKGDMNGDNGINIIDISIINTAFGSVVTDVSYEPLADVNCDDGVNIIDVSIINTSFGLVGDQPE